MIVSLILAVCDKLRPTPFQSGSQQEDNVMVLIGNISMAPKGIFVNLSLNRFIGS